MNCLVVLRLLYGWLGEETTKLWHISPAQYSVIQPVRQPQFGRRQPRYVRNVVCLRGEALCNYFLTHACKVRCKINCLLSIIIYRLHDYSISCNTLVIFTEESKTSNEINGAVKIYWNSVTAFAFVFKNGITSFS